MINAPNDIAAFEKTAVSDGWTLKQTKTAIAERSNKL